MIKLSPEQTQLVATALKRALNDMITLGAVREANGVTLAMAAVSDAMADADPEFQPIAFLQAVLQDAGKLVEALKGSDPAFGALSPTPGARLQ